MLPRKRAVPSVREVEPDHVKHEHRVVSWRTAPENLAQRAFGIAFELFGFHF